MCRAPSNTSPNQVFALAKPPSTFKNRKGSPATVHKIQKVEWHSIDQQEIRKIEAKGLPPPKFEVHFNPTISNAAGALRACRSAVFESSPSARIDFVSVNSKELTNRSSHIVITCVELDSIPLVKNGIAPCEIIRMEQRLMNSDNSTWCLAFRGLVALKSASRLTKLRQVQLSKLCSPQSTVDDIQLQHTYIPAHQKQPVKKVYKERKNPIFGFSSDDLRNSYTRQIDKLYKHHCPSKRQSVPTLVKQYRGKEEYLLQKVRSKYCNPASRQAIYV